MKGNARKEWEKVASAPLFKLYRSTMEPNLFQVRLNGSGGYLRRRLSAPSVEAAMSAAPSVAGIVKPADESRIVSLADAFRMALEQSTRRERAREHWLWAAGKFLQWLRVRYPLCTHWGLVTRQVLREYLGTFEGKAANTKRLGLQPVLQTARFMHLEFGFPNVGERFGIGSKLKTAPKVVYLEDVHSFCNFLRDRGSHLEVGACLQGLAGLQLLEALRLSWDQVDLELGLVEISGEVKNEYRNRVIPVCRRVLEALERATRVEGKVRLVRAPVVVGARGEAFEHSTSYGRQIRAALLAWNPRTDWAPKDLRNCLPTFSKMEGVHGTIWEQYVGHAPRTVTERHYVPRLAARTAGEEKALERQMDLFRRFVTVPVDQALRSGRESCNFLQVGQSGD